METHHLFHIASMTRVITSTAILQLYEDGRLSLDDSVEMYIPEFDDSVVLTAFNEETGDYETRPASRDITIHDLLTHTSGVSYGFTITTEKGKRTVVAWVGEGYSKARTGLTQNMTWSWF